MKRWMTIRFFILVCLFLSFCLVSAQKTNRYGIKIDRIATEEKKSLTDDELRHLNGVVCSDSTLFAIDPCDTLKINKEKYILLYSPLQASYKKSDLVTYDDDEIMHIPLSKRYILEWTVKNDSLYITGSKMHPDYKGRKKKDVIQRDIELILDKKFKDGELLVDWLVAENGSNTVINLYVTDTAKKKIYSLKFENGKFISMKHEEHLRYTVLLVEPGINPVYRQ